MARPLIDYDDDDRAIMSLAQIEHQADKIDRRPKNNREQVSRRQDERSALMKEISRFVEKENLTPLNTKEQDKFIQHGWMPALERSLLEEPEEINKQIAQKVEEKTGESLSDDLLRPDEVYRSYLHPETMKKIHAIKELKGPYAKSVYAGSVALTASVPHVDIVVDVYELLMGVVAKDTETIGEALFAMGPGKRDAIKVAGRGLEAIADIIPEAISEWVVENEPALDNEQKKLLISALVTAGVPPQTADTLFHSVNVAVDPRSHAEMVSALYKDSMSLVGETTMDIPGAVGITPELLSSGVTKALEFISIGPEDPRYKPVGLQSVTEMFREAEDFVPGYPYEIQR